MALDIRPETLYKKSNSYAIKQLITEIYKSVTHSIHEARRKGLSEIYYDLPNNLSIDGFEPSDIQLIVYANIIEKIKEQELKVGLIYHNDSAILRIRWPSILDPAEKERYKRILIDALEKNPDGVGEE